MRSWLWAMSERARCRFTKIVNAIRKRFASASVEGKSNGHGILNGNGTGKINSHLD